MPRFRGHWHILYLEMNIWGGDNNLMPPHSHLTPPPPPGVPLQVAKVVKRAPVYENLFKHLAASL